MIKFSFLILIGSAWTASYAQPSRGSRELTDLFTTDHTPVKDQAMTGTCWSFSTTSLIESQAMHDGLGEFDLSEMFTVRNIYIEKAKNYILRQGTAQFGPGGLGTDVIHSIGTYGAVPENVFSGLMLGSRAHDHRLLDAKVKSFLDSLLTLRPLPENWMQKFQSILDDHLGKVPEKFVYKEKTYTPQTFASEVLHFKGDDYVGITSFTHHPYYAPFVLEVPDNFSNSSYYNLPLSEMMDLVFHAVEKGYSVMWDADVSNPDFKQKLGFAMEWNDPEQVRSVDVNVQEMPYDERIRQRLFENLTTEDDHLMHLIGVARSPAGKRFFVVKNSWGEVGPFKGLIKVSEAYFAINTISLVVPKAAMDATLKEKLGIH
jgi:bleomycin hydrolase